MPRLPKFEQKIQERLIQPQFDQKASSGYGIIMDYDPYTNRATVVMANGGSDDVGEMFLDVPCPVQVGVQSMAPERGRPCWLSFKDNSTAFPVVTHYFNHVYEDIDYQRQNKAVNSTPRFMLM